MHWTHEQFLAQPEWFIRALRIKLSVFARVENQRAKEAQRNAGGVQ